MKKVNLELKKLSIAKERIVVLSGEATSDEAAIPSCMPECYRVLQEIPSCMPECY